LHAFSLTVLESSDDDRALHERVDQADEVVNAGAGEPDPTGRRDRGGRRISVEQPGADEPVSV
jgi:hypothetical protein